MGTDKRERQKLGRQAKIEQEVAAAKKQRTFKTARNLGIAVLVVGGLAFAYSRVAGDDDPSDETAGEDSSTTTTVPETTTTTYSNPELAKTVLGRDAPDPEPPATTTGADALEIKTLIEGEGEGVKAGDTVVAHYYLKTPDPKVFQSSWDAGQPLSFVIAAQPSQLIAGWDEGLIGAKIGERRRLVVGSNKAYGATGKGEGEGSIPPNTPLAFEIDIVDILPAAAG